MRIEFDSYLWGEGVDNSDFDPFLKQVGTGEDGGDEFLTKLVLEGDYAELREVVAKWLRRVAQQAWSVGGDDTYYDYYPDKFYMAGQMVDELGLTAEMRFTEDFAIAVRYDVEGQLDGLGLTSSQDDAELRWMNVMSNPILMKAHLLRDGIQGISGYWLSNLSGRRLDVALSRNKQWENLGGPADLAPYRERELEHFKRGDENA